MCVDTNVDIMQELLRSFFLRRDNRSYKVSITSSAKLHTTSARIFEVLLDLTGVMDHSKSTSLTKWHLLIPLPPMSRFFLFFSNFPPMSFTKK